MTAPVSIAHAALVCGCSENALRRWIASGKLSAERVDDKYLVRPADVARLVADVPALESAPGTAGGPVQEVDPDARTDDEDARPVGPPGTDIMRAEAMTAYTRSLLEPLLALVQQQGTTIREQAETIGRQAADLEARATARSSGASGRTPWVLAALASVGVVLLFVALVVVVLSPR
jgi:hypothetical protein